MPTPTGIQLSLRRLLVGDDGDVADFHPLRGRDEEGGVEGHQLAAGGWGHVVAGGGPGGVELFGQGLELGFFVFGPVVLLEGRLVYEAVPGVGDEGAVGEFGGEGAGFGAGRGRRGRGGSRRRWLGRCRAGRGGRGGIPGCGAGRGRAGYFMGQLYLTNMMRTVMSDHPAFGRVGLGSGAPPGR